MAIGVGWFGYYIVPAFAPDALAVRDAQHLARGAAADETLVLDLPTVTFGTFASENPAPSEGEAPHALGGTTVPRMDTETAGHGGDATAREQALNLSDGDEHMTLSMDLMNRLDREQVQRLRVARRRQSWDDRRATKNPMELTFVQNGFGHVTQHRVAATADPSRGALLSAKPSTLGGPSGAPPLAPSSSDDEATRGDEPPVHVETALGGEHTGSSRRSPGMGLSEAAVGTEHHASALIASARPDVTRGPIAVPANVHDRPNDDMESDQEAARALQALVHASTAGGMAGGDGRGGTGGGGDPGAGASLGVGSHTHALGVGDGEVFELYTGDPRLMPYFRDLKRKIEPLWANAFPKSAILELKQGTVILEFTVASDGSATVSWPPLRPSGVEEFDRNCAEAIRRASPFPPIPSQLGRGSLRIRAPFIASNPMVK